MDLAPTVLALAGLDVNLRMQGQPLAGVFQRIDSPSGWTLCRLRHSDPSGRGNWQTTYCTETMKLVVKHAAGQADVCELYNLANDPDELHNLANYTEHETELESMIDQMIDARCALEDRTEPRISEF